MNRSEVINDLASALAKAQGQFEPAIFNRLNPHFKSKFADLKSCIDSCRKPLSENGLGVLQGVRSIGDKTVLVTLLTHASGQWVETEYPLMVSKMDSQGMGSAMTYAKRYALCATLGIVSDEDDDGEASIDRNPKKPERTVQVKHEKPAPKADGPLMSFDQIQELDELLIQCDLELVKPMMTFNKTNFGSNDFAKVPAKFFEQYKQKLSGFAKESNEKFKEMEMAQ